MKMKLRWKMLLTNGVFILFLFYLFFLNERFVNVQKSISQLRIISRELQKEVKNLNIAQLQLVSVDAREEGLYQFGTAPSLEQLKSARKAIDGLQTDYLFTYQSIFGEFPEEVLPIYQLIRLHENQLQEFIRLLKLRGYKDYATEGELRRAIHELESLSTKENELSRILMIRRHEKDFLLRGNYSYTELLRLRSEELKTYWATHKGNGQKQELLKEYVSAFFRLVHIEEKLGISGSNGLFKSLQLTRNRINEKVNYWDNSLNQRILHREGNLKKAKWMSWGVIVIGLALYFVWLSYLFDRRIKSLSQGIKSFVESSFLKPIPPLQDVRIADELSELSLNIRKMEKEISVSFREFRENSEIRTREILSQKEKIEDQRDLLVKQKGLIEKRNNEMLDSLRYAKRIQNYLFPKESKFRKYFDDHFVLFRPKDIVSGDFFWLEMNDEDIYLGLGDCTGHGVPGAFMSIIGISILNEALFEKGIRNTDQILNYLNFGISEKFGQKGVGSQIKDGMDIALIRITRYNGQFRIQFSGAQRPLLVYSGGQFKEIKGDRLPIGWVFGNFLESFSAQWIDLQEGDQVFLYSDGYADQFGGEDQKKMKVSKLKDLLSRFSDLKGKDQFREINQFFESWKGEHEQIDDVTLIGIRPGSKTNNSLSGQVLTLEKELTILATDPPST